MREKERKERQKFIIMCMYLCVEGKCYVQPVSLLSTYLPVRVHVCVCVHFLLYIDEYMNKCPYRMGESYQKNNGYSNKDIDRPSSRINNNNEGILRAPVHVKHAHLC